MKDLWPVRFIMSSKRHRVWVQIYPSQRSMLAAARQEGIAVANDTDALVCRSTGFPAVAFFHQRGLTHGNIAHEMLHAAANILEDRKLSLMWQTEETLAEITGNLVDCFYRRLWDLVLNGKAPNIWPRLK